MVRSEITHYSNCIIYNQLEVKTWFYSEHPSDAWAYADVISTVYVPVLMQHVKQAMAKLGVESDLEMTESTLQALKSSWEKNLWTGIFASIKDWHAMEKLVEALLREMAAKIETDMLACCILWMTFGSLLPKHNLTRYVAVTMSYTIMRDALTDA